MQTKTYFWHLNFFNHLKIKTHKFRLLFLKNNSSKSKSYTSMPSLEVVEQCLLLIDAKYWLERSLEASRIMEKHDSVSKSSEKKKFFWTKSVIKSAFKIKELHISGSFRMCRTMSAIDPCQKLAWEVTRSQPNHGKAWRF